MIFTRASVIIRLGYPPGIVPIIAVETIGSNCFYDSVSLNSGQSNSIAKALPQGVDLVEKNGVLLAKFNGFSSKASGSLGASQPAAEVVKMALARKGGVRCVSVPDELSMQAAGSFAGASCCLTGMC